jgi:hypothetical protein
MARFDFTGSVEADDGGVHFRLEGDEGDMGVTLSYGDAERLWRGLDATVGEMIREGEAVGRDYATFRRTGVKPSYVRDARPLRIGDTACWQQEIGDPEVGPTGGDIHVMCGEVIALRPNGDVDVWREDTRRTVTIGRSALIDPESEAARETGDPPPEPSPDLDRVAGAPVRVGTRIRVELDVDEGGARLDPPFAFQGTVVDINPDFVWINEDGGRGEQEYVLRSGFYGAHGDLSGIVDLADAGDARVTVLR